MSIQSQPTHTNTPAPRPPRRPRTPIVIAATLIFLVIAGGLGWWLAGPLFYSNTANDTNPFAATTQQPTTQATTQPKQQATTTIEQKPTTETSPTPTGPVTLATGNFIDLGDGIHHGAGKITIGKTSNGEYALNISNLNVTNGPDLYVYLSTPKKTTNGDEVKNGGTNLGRLTANEGSITIPISKVIGNNLKNYNSIVIYCEAFSVLFTIATLNHQS